MIVPSIKDTINCATEVKQPDIPLNTSGYSHGESHIPDKYILSCDPYSENSEDWKVHIEKCKIYDEAFLIQMKIQKLIDDAEDL